MEPRPRIAHDYRVRFDEADADGRLRASGFLRYAQDMAWRHSEEAGFGRDWYDERSMHWLVRNVSLAIEAAVTYGDVLTISTEVIGWRHVWARRRCDFHRDGQPVATVDTDWVLLRDDGRPAKVPAEIARYFAPIGTFPRRKVTLPEPTAEVTRFSTRVRPLDVDPLRHMNNAAYVDMVDDGIGRLPDGQRPGTPDRYHVGYLLPARPGTALEVACWPTGDDQVACRISGGDGAELMKALVGRSERPPS